ncbi:MAG: hypothetical protein IKF11_00550 [Methanobrevibacter sp.]|nr:hypothetical protein [Methanobrevibacter sp.]
MVNKHCKHFRHEPYMTPNNYDLYFDPEQIPVNIPRENVPNLTNRLQKLIPLSKKIHINLTTNPETITESNTFTISTKMKINNHEVKFL